MGRAVWKADGATKKNPDGAFNINKRLGQLRAFSGQLQIIPWAALFHNLTKLN